ncbi:MAG: hypothetical protein JSV49_05475 [Thermoplasmata archaeon]|nr:MAG: hypothetical protein JSV49_05475 [Thermoplasmata archaeon]
MRSFNIAITLTLLFILGLAPVIIISDNAAGVYNYDVNLSCTETEKDADKDHEAVYYLTVRNKGLNDDVYKMTFSNPKSDTWLVKFKEYLADEPEIAVKAGQTGYINLSVIPSCGCEEGNTLTVDVTAYSTKDQSTFQSIRVVTTYEQVSNNGPGNGGTDPTDSDGDTWTDSEEEYLGTDPNDPSDYPQPNDSDNDGWTNDDEKFYGTNPYDKTSYPVDSDEDGLTNDREISLGTDPMVADTDGDGQNDYFEYEHGTDPLDPKSFSYESPDGEDATEDDAKSSDEKTFFGLKVENDAFFIAIPVLIIIIIISMIILFYVWRPERDEKPRNLKDADDFDDERVEDPSEMKRKSANTYASSSKIETIDVKLEKSSSGYKCPECDRYFNKKNVKRHLLRKHHKRIKRL